MFDLINELVEREWKFEMIHDDYDDYCLHLILDDEEHFIYDDEDAKHLISIINKFYGGE